MNISQISGRTLYLEDMDGLTTTGSPTKPTRITLALSAGITIFSATHYGDTNGTITLNLSKILKDFAYPPIPSNEWLGDSSNALDLTLTVGSSSYSFTLNLFSRDAQDVISDIDCLDIPMELPEGIPISLHTNSSIAYINLRTASDEILLSTETCSGNVLKGCYSKNIPYDIAAGKPFQIHVSTVFVSRFSPIYRPQPYDFQLYLFRNRLGAMELFPMSGDIHLLPSFKFEIGKSGSKLCSMKKEDSVEIKQFTGHITATASRVLATMLQDNYAFHYINGDWRRIIITDTDLSLKRGDFIHKQSFTFRYQDPIDIVNINF